MQSIVLKNYYICKHLIQKIMKKLLLIFLTLLFVSCISVKFPETVAIDLQLDKESAKNLTEAINKSNSKIHMMRLHKDGPISMKSDENIVISGIINDSEDFDWIGDDGKKMKKVMIRGERFGKGPNANRYMDELPKAIIDRIKTNILKISYMGIQ